MTGSNCSFLFPKDEDGWVTGLRFHSGGSSAFFFRADAGLPDRSRFTAWMTGGTDPGALVRPACCWSASHRTTTTDVRKGIGVPGCRPGCQGGDPIAVVYFVEVKGSTRDARWRAE